MKGYNAVLELKTVSHLFSREGVPFNLSEISEEIQKKIEDLILPTKGGVEEEIIGIPSNYISKINELLFKKYDNKVRVSVLGLFNRGKTFVLNGLGDVELDSSFKVHTEGISISVPENGQIAIFDSAGTNVPLTRDFLDYEIIHHGAFKPTTEDPENVEDFSQLEEAEKRREIEEANYHSELTHFAIVRKKNTEVYIQKCLFQLSNVILVVVNEMTWADQQYISSIVANIKKSESKYGKIKLFVVHNYKSAVSMDDFEKLRKLYVTDVYHGSLKETPQGACVFVESKNRVEHVFLCQNNSEAGNKVNRKSLDYILINIVSGNFATAIRENFLSEFMRVNESRISEIIRNEENRIELCWNLKKKNFSIRVPIENPQYILPRIDITPDSMMVLKSNDFLIEADQIEDESNLILTVDVPGFTEAEINAKSSVSSQSGKLKIHVDEINFTITISGERKLKLRKYFADLDKFTSYINYTDHKYTNVSIERTYGLFYREFTIPRNYNITAFKKDLQNGELTMVFPRKVKLPYEETVEV